MKNENDNKVELLMQGKQLVHTSYEVTAIQNRIFYYCLLNAQKESSGNLCCEVDLDKLKSLIPNTNQRTLSNIKKTLQILRSTSLEFENKEGEDSIECEYNLIAGHEYNKTKGKFKIFFMDRLYKHIINYTVYAPLNLDILTRFKSFYSQRLYELLRLWSRTDEVIIKDFKLDQLRFILGVENKYPNYKNFKQRVISQAIKEINDLGNMEVFIDEVKKGRKVEAIRFTILDRERKKYFKHCDQENKEDNKTQETVREDKTIEVIDTIKKEKNKSTFYVPNKKLFTPKTLANFKSDFGNYDFRNNELKKILQESIIATLEKDNEDKVKVKAYSYFKTALKDKIDKLENKKEKEVNTRYHNINQTFTKYDSEELEKMLKQSQQGKFDEYLMK